MNNLLNKKYLIISVIIHVLILVGGSIFSYYKNKQRAFIVFGAHSKHPSKTELKTRGYSVPFANPHKKATGKKKALPKKAAIKKPSRTINRKNVPPQSKKPFTKNSSPQVAKRKKQTSLQKKIKLLAQKSAQELAEVQTPEIQENTPHDEVRLTSKPKKKNTIKKIETPNKQKLKKRKVKKIEPPPQSKEEVIEEPKEISPQEIFEEQKEPENATTLTPAPIPQEDSASLPPDTSQEAGEVDQTNEQVEEPYPSSDELEFNLFDVSNPQILVYQKKVQHAVNKLWRPPVGIPKDTECCVRLYVDEHGDIAKVEKVKSSKILIYDLSVLQAAKRLHFDDEYLTNKKIVIVFHQ